MPIADPTAWKNTPHADQDAWIDFTGSHSLQHHAFDVAIRSLGGAPYSVLPIGTTGRLDAGKLNYYPNEDWHSVHQQMHDGMASALIIAAAPDMQSYDLTDPDQFASWAVLHALEHVRIRQSLGI